MTSSLQNRILLAFCSLLCLFFFSSQPLAFADSVGIYVSPTVLTIHPQENGVIKKTVTLRNTGKSALTIKILPEMFKAATDGTLIYLNQDSLDDETKNFITQDVVVLENDIPVTSLTLTPDQSQHLTLQITINNIQKLSEYTFSLLFISTNPTSLQTMNGTDSPLNAGMDISIGSALHVLIAGKQVSAASVAIQTFQTRSFYQNGPVTFQVTANNNADNYINLYGNIIITNMFGQQIGLIRIPNSILLAKATTHLNQEGTISWSEQFLLGQYTAKLTLLDEEGHTVSSTATFFAFPFRQTLLVLFGLFIASFFIGEVRKRIR